MKRVSLVGIRTYLSQEYMLPEDTIEEYLEKAGESIDESLLEAKHALATGDYDAFS